MSLVTRTNHNIISTIDVYVYRFIRTNYHAGQIFIPHRHKSEREPLESINPIFIKALFS